ncbi:MAG TPA: hypothetical protein VH063_18875 [Gaiellaceae bacterium]|nr:hypothetical protein [Gaiellaceae bacterium]
MGERVAVFRGNDPRFEAEVIDVRYGEDPIWGGIDDGNRIFTVRRVDGSEVEVTPDLIGTKMVVIS